MLLLQQMIVLFTYMMLGFLGGKLKSLDERSAKTLSWIVVNISNPALILNAVVNGEGKPPKEGLLLAALMAAIINLTMFTIAQIVPILFRVPKDEKGVYKIMTMFNNIGFMGFPLIASVYGTGALLYASIFTLPSNILSYTYGIHLIKKGGEEENILSKIFNVGVIACIIAVTIYFVEPPVPGVIQTIVTGLGGTSGPLSMMVIGLSLSQLNLKELFLDGRLLLFSGMKLLLIPIIGTTLIRMFLPNELLSAVCMIMLATPVASVVAMFAHQYDSNVELASKGVALTTLLSVITIPIVSAVVF